MKHRFAACLSFVVAACVFVLSPAPSAAAGDSLATELDGILSPAKIGKKTKAGAIILDLDTGKAIYSHNATLALMPASNMKLLTTAAALCELGEDAELVTELRTNGSISGATLSGDLMLIGRGDPNLSGRFHDGDVTKPLKDLAVGLIKRGVTKVTGKLLFDDSYFSGERYHPDWPEDQYLKWYTAEVSALTLNDNCVTIVATPTSSGAKARITTLPTTSYISLSPKVESIGGKADPVVGFSRDRASNTVSVWGKVATGRGAYQGECTVHDPAAYCAQVMKETLAVLGIMVAGGVERRGLSRKEQQSWGLVGEFRSGLAETLFVTNTNSQNLYAECLFRVLGAEQSSEGSFAGGQKAVKAFLEDHDLPTKDIAIEDGSGLSRTNRVTADLLADVLKMMAKRDDFAIFKSSLAVSGSTGTLDNRLTGESTKGRVFAKTGYIDGVGALSGYLDTRSGRHYVFSIILNDFSGSARTTLDGVVTALAKR